ncbi:MAG: tetratricopeptide repeat protein [Candidatus Obscuribacterales bacterium]|nr:tetratricopeptide repeat protein [Candidatus Obscuribacterales bacterium]
MKSSAEIKRRNATKLTLSLFLGLSLASPLALLQPAAAQFDPNNFNLSGMLNFKNGNDCTDKGNYAQARQCFESAIKDFQAPGMEFQKAKAINGLGIALWRMGLIKQAESRFREALALTEQYKGKTCQEYAATQNNLALMLQLQGKFDESETLFRNSLALCEATGSQNKADYLTNLAGLFQDQGKFDQSEKYYKEALQYGQNDRVQEAITLNDLGTLYRDMDRYAEAEQVAKKAADILKAQYGSNHSFSAAATANLGQIYARQGRYDQALPIMKEALTAKEASVGPDHPMVATSLVGLAEIDLQQGKLDSAETLLDRALSIRKDKLGLETPDTAQVLELMGQVKIRRGAKSDAQRILQKALDIRESLLGSDNALTSKTKVLLAEALTAQANFDQAEKLLKQAIDQDSQSLGNDSARVAMDLDQLALLYKAMNRPADAKQASERAMAIKAKLPGGARLKQRQKLTDIENLDLSLDLSQAPTATSATPASTYPSTPAGTTGTAGNTKPNTTNIALATPPSMPNITPTAVSAGKATPRPVREKWALVIGISNFKDPALNLKYSAKDARDFHDYLIKRGNFKPENTKLLIDEEATRENILELLGDSWLPKVVQPDDLVVIYISSHGSPSELDVGGDNFLVVYDTKPTSLFTSGISMKHLMPTIKERLKSDRVLCVFDACHSGATNEKATIDNGGAKGLFYKNADNFDSQQLTQGTGQMVICSSAPDQVSWESKQYANGVFTRQLIDILATDNAGMTTIRKAFGRLKENVQAEVLRDRGRVQTPELKSAWNGADLNLSIATASK